MCEDMYQVFSPVLCTYTFESSDLPRRWEACQSVLLLTGLHTPQPTAPLLSSCHWAAFTVTRSLEQGSIAILVAGPLLDSFFSLSHQTVAELP